LCGHPQGGNNKDTLTVILCRNQATVKKVIQFWLNSRLKEYRTDKYTALEDKELLYVECSAVNDVPRTYM